MDIEQVNKQKNTIYSQYYITMKNNDDNVDCRMKHW